jgi:SPP1 family predicted phage head-tail adaptor
MIGKRKHIAIIKSRTAGVDAADQPLNTWTVTVATVWADVRFLRGLETIKGGAETSQVSASINMAYRTNLTTDMRIECMGLVFQIKAILPDLAGKKFVDVACEVIA